MCCFNAPSLSGGGALPRYLFCLVAPPLSRGRHPAISLENGVMGQRKRVAPPLLRGGRHPAVSVDMEAVGLPYQLTWLVTLLAL